MAKLNRIFPAWRKAKKGERMPGQRPPKPKVVKEEKKDE